MFADDPPRAHGLESRQKGAFRLHVIQAREKRGGKASEGDFIAFERIGAAQVVAAGKARDGVLLLAKGQAGLTLLR